jgi:hypothetical protein
MPITLRSHQPSVSLFLPNLAGGGAERAMLHLAQGFAARGIKTDLVLAQVEGAYLEKVPANVRPISRNSSKIGMETQVLFDLSWCGSFILGQTRS